MPDWLLHYCTIVMTLVGGLVATVGILFLIIIASVEVYDWFAEKFGNKPADDNDGYLFDDEMFR